VDVAGPRPPEWAGGPFQVLLFRCGGMRLGIPLTALRALVCLARAPTRLPGLPAWHLGVCLARGGKVGVADLGRLLRPGSDGAAQGANNYVLLLAHGPWGLACESLGSAQRVEPQAVRWRRDGSRAPLIQGVIRESLTPLLSAEAILASIGA
jgi:purine-binding chemotaxis protein CheW